MEEEFGCLIRKGEIAEFIDDEQIDACEMIEERAEPSGDFIGRECLCELFGGKEQDCRLLGSNSRASSMSDVMVREGKDTRLTVTWKMKKPATEWAQPSEEDFFPYTDDDFLPVSNPLMIARPLRFCNNRESAQLSHIAVRRLLECNSSLLAFLNSMERNLRSSIGADLSDLTEHMREAQHVLTVDPVFSTLGVERSRAYARESRMRETGKAAIFPTRTAPQVAEYSMRKSYGRLLSRSPSVSSS